jgi:UPF0755 protein
VIRRLRARGGSRAAPKRGGDALLWLLSLAILAASAGWLLLGAGPAARSGAATGVVLPPGAGVSGVARTLEAAGVVRSRWAFVAGVLATGAGHRLKAGEYEFRSGESLLGVISQIARGEVVRHFVTVPEGLTSRQAAAIVSQADFLTGAAPVPPEGSLLPETYEAQLGDSRQAVLTRMARAQERLLDQLWPQRAAGLPLRSPADAVALASVVEKETAKPAERPHVAAVFLNRLRKGMRLESDPTVIYALSQGEPLGRPLRASELGVDSPYNTYRFAGLPPSPIGNPGRASLEAVLRPAQSNDLYFVADGTGGHVFAETFEAHKRNVAQWRAISQARQAGRPRA